MILMATAALLKSIPDTRAAWTVFTSPSTNADPFTYERKRELLKCELMKQKNVNLSFSQRYIYKNPLDVNISKLIIAGNFSSSVDSSLPTDAQHNYVLDLINSWKSQVEVEDLISRISALANVVYAERISNRLLNLRKVFLEEQDSDISADSIRTFTIFLSMHPDARYPAITLTPVGNIYAQWKKDRTSLFSLQFLPDWGVRFVVFAPNKKHSEIITRISGTETVDTVLGNMDKAYGVSDWVVE